MRTLRTNMPNPDFYTSATRLRALVGAVDTEMAQAPEALRDAWAKLVAVLALGPAPELRECPRCHGIGARAASRCGVCWTALPALPPRAPEAQQ